MHQALFLQHVIVLAPGDLPPFGSNRCSLSAYTVYRTLQATSIGFRCGRAPQGGPVQARSKARTVLVTPVCEHSDCGKRLW